MCLKADQVVANGNRLGAPETQHVLGALPLPSQILAVTLRKRAIRQFQFAGLFSARRGPDCVCLKRSRHGTRESRAVGTLETTWQSVQQQMGKTV